MLKLKELLDTQRKFSESLNKKVSANQYVFAMNIEISELLNTLPWKWWKNNHTIDKEKSLDELADVLAFWLSWYNLYFDNHRKTASILDVDLYSREVEGLEAAILKGIAKETASNPNILSVHYEDNYTMVQLETAGQRLGKLIAVTMYHTGAKLQEVIDAYHKKMDINWERQKNNY